MNLITIFSRKSASIFILALFFFISVFNKSEIKAETFTVTLWHSFRGNEEKALKYIADIYNLTNNGTRINLTALSADTFSFVTEIENIANKSNAPDLFIWVNDKTGGWADKKKILAVSDYIDFTFFSSFINASVKGLEYKNKIYGLPLSIECLALFYNKKYIARPPSTMRELIEQSKKFIKENSNTFGLIYPVNDVYYHSVWLHAFGGRTLDNENKISLNNDKMLNSIKYIRELKIKEKIIPDYNLTGENWWTKNHEMFKSGRSLFFISGPWSIGSLQDFDSWEAAPLPKFDDGKPLSPFLGIKGIFLLNKKRNEKQLKACIDVMKFFSSANAGMILANIGGYIPANLDSYKNSYLNSNKIAVTFRNQAINSIPMPNHSNLAKVWTLNTMFDEDMIFSKPDINDAYINIFLKNAEKRMR